MFISVLYNILIQYELHAPAGGLNMCAYIYIYIYIYI
jgi:hypothetical protein